MCLVAVGILVASGFRVWLVALGVLVSSGFGVSGAWCLELLFAMAVII